MALTFASSEPSPLCFGACHGYRFEGDWVHLHAELHASEGGPVVGARWALQLWASQGDIAEQIPEGAILVAEMPFWPQQGVTALSESLLAHPPAGTAGWTMALALMAEVDGQWRQQDLVVYPELQHFCHPRFQGEIRAAFAADTVTLQIGGILNPRRSDNLSGTLSLEVWALTEPYAGGSWSGRLLAGTTLRPLAGECLWSDDALTLPLQAAVGGEMCVLMVREWTPTGYLTRDFRGLNASVPAVEVSVSPVLAEPQAMAPVAVVAAAPVPETAVSVGVSVNTATLDELLTIKGLSRPAAKGILAARPYAALSELVRAKGIGEKLLAKLLPFLTL